MAAVRRCIARNARSIAYRGPGIGQLPVAPRSRTSRVRPAAKLKRNKGLAEVNPSAMLAQMHPAPKHHHAVQFYGSDDSLCTTVASFLSEGLILGQPAIVIATPEHCQAIDGQLRRRFIDCAAARKDGDLIVLDAEETLALFTGADGMPDADLFQEHLSRVIRQTLSGRSTTLRAYGEMVDLLWRRGQADAALRLEILWNKLALQHSFALLCGYSMGSFYKQTDRMEEIAALHSEVIDSNLIPFPQPKAAF